MHQEKTGCTQEQEIDTCIDTSIFKCVLFYDHSNSLLCTYFGGFYNILLSIKQTKKIICCKQSFEWTSQLIPNTCQGHIWSLTAPDFIHSQTLARGHGGKKTSSPCALPLLLSQMWQFCLSLLILSSVARYKNNWNSWLHKAERFIETTTKRYFIAQHLFPEGTKGSCMVI